MDIIGHPARAHRGAVMPNISDADAWEVGTVTAVHGTGATKTIAIVGDDGEVRDYPAACVLTDSDEPGA